MRLARCLAAGAVAIGVIAAYAQPAQASPTYYTAGFIFTKNSAHPNQSKLSLTIREIVSGIPRPPVVNVTVRAGSGDGNTNACATNHGWLPNGTYFVRDVYSNHLGTVTGHAFYLSDKKCSNGTKRTALFIHSTYPWSSNHYFSEGCIKVNNTDINTLYNDYKKYFPVNKSYTNGVPHVAVFVQ